MEVTTHSREQIKKLESAMRSMPQAEGIVTTHHFSPGMYLRKVYRPAGTVIVGKVHKAPHFFLCAAGQILVSGPSGVKTLNPGDVIESTPGTKRATYALTDAIGITVHLTDKTDIEEIERELIEPDDEALFDALNEVKHQLLEAA